MMEQLPHDLLGESIRLMLGTGMPGSCIRVQFVPSGTSSHSQTFVDAGKSKAGHDAILYGAKILSGSILDLIQTEGLMEKLQADFEDAKKKA